MLRAKSTMNRLNRALGTTAFKIRWCITSSVSVRNATGESQGSTSNDLKIAKSRHSEYFNKDNPMEAIKEEFQLEMQDMEQYASNFQFTMPTREIYENIARISERLDALDRDHQAFSDIHNAVTRALKHSSRNVRDKEEDTMQHVQKRFAEINGKSDPNLKALQAEAARGKGKAEEESENQTAFRDKQGTYAKAKQYGKALITKYHAVMSNQYRNINEQLVRPIPNVQ